MGIHYQEVELGEFKDTRSDNYKISIRTNENFRRYLETGIPDIWAEKGEPILDVVAGNYNGEGITQLGKKDLEDVAPLIAAMPPSEKYSEALEEYVKEILSDPARQNEMTQIVCNANLNWHEFPAKEERNIEDEYEYDER